MMPHRKPELQKIIRDLEHFVKTTCEYDPKHPKQFQNFVGETCNDAVLMLHEAYKGLEEELKEKKK